MATVKIRFNRLAAATIRYVLSHGRENDPLDGENCTPDPETLIQQFKTVRDVHNFSGGNEIVHLIHSWGPAESRRLSPKEVNEMGRKLAGRYFPGHQFFVATHTDREHVHNHIVVSTVNMETGRRIHNEFRHLHALRDINDAICRERGLEIPNREGRERAARMPDIVQRMTKHHRFSFIRDIQQKADFGRAYATSYEEYVGILGEMGISARVEAKNITYFYPGQARGKRGKNLGRLYDKPGLERAFRENDERFQREPKIRALVRGRIHALRADPGSLQRPPPSLGREIGGARSPGQKDYANFTRMPRREGRPAFDLGRDLGDSLIPIGEINRASRANIIDYCKRKGIELARHEDGTWRLRDRDHVVISDVEWTNTKNHTRGSLIDFVAAHRDMTYLQAIAHINGNPRLLLLEEHFGEQKRKFQSFYVPKDDQARRAEALTRLTDLLSAHNVAPRHAEHLLKDQQVQVTKAGVIRFFGKDSGDGTLEFYQDGHGQWQRRSHGKAPAPFMSVPGRGHAAVVFMDPLSFLQRDGAGKTRGKQSDGPTLVLLAPDRRPIDRLIAENKHIDRISLAVPDPKHASPTELFLFNELNDRYRHLGIEIDLFGFDRLSRGRGPEISF